MALKVVNRKLLPIGIDLGTGAIKLAQVRLVEGDFELLAAGVEELGLDRPEKPSQRLHDCCERIRRIMRTGDFKGRQCVLSLPSETTFIHHIRIPKSKPEAAERAIAEEIEAKLPYPARDASIRHIACGDVYSDNEPRQETIVVCTARSTLDAYLSMARRAKLDVVGVNVEACAIVECFARMFRRANDQARTVLFVDLGATSTQVVLSHGGRIVFARNLGIGGLQLDEAVAEGLDATVARAHALRMAIIGGNADRAAEDELYGALETQLETITGEIRQCLRYYESVFQGRAIERAVFLGGQAHDKRLCQSIAQRLNVPAQIGDPLVRMKRVESEHQGMILDVREPHPAWAVAVGLSMGCARAA